MVPLLLSDLAWPLSLSILTGPYNPALKKYAECLAVTSLCTW